MDNRRSSSLESADGGGYYKSRRDYGRGRRSRTRSRSRNRSMERNRSGRRISRSRSRTRGEYMQRRSPDLYRELITQDYQDDGRGGNAGGGGGDRDTRNYYRNAMNERPRDRERDRERERDRDRDRDRDRRRDRDYKKGYSPMASSYLEEISNDSHDSDGGDNYYTQTPNNKIIVRGLAQHITEADISNDLMQYGLKPVSIRLIRKKKTGASRGFAFVEFSTEEEATRWMDYKQGILMLQDQYRAVIQYSIPKDPPGSSREKYVTDWYCGKCLVLNFKRRDNCFKCFASREESEKGGEGSDEVSNILTKKIMLRNLDVLTNEEGVLTTMQEAVPTLVSKIAKILICRDPLTNTSRGVCYLSFDNLVDSMNTHNALKALEPPLRIDTREVLVSYCVDGETSRPPQKASQQSTKHQGGGGGGGRDRDGHDMSGSYHGGHGQSSQTAYQYTLADVPRLAEYSASLYASNSTEHDHYLKYYTQYYITQITKGQFSNLPTMSQMGMTVPTTTSMVATPDTANSGAAVAQSAMQRKMQKSSASGNNHKQQVSHHQQHLTQGQNQIVTPKGNDGKKYPTPDISLYQYDETSGYYYDPLTGLYYDANSQYYYNNETNSYLYWDNENSTYVAAPSTTSSAKDTNSTTNVSSAAKHSTSKHPAITTAASSSSLATNQVDANSDNSQGAFDRTDERKDKKENKQDKVKVAKKIVKDMEKWAKQLNQKKDMMQVMPQQPIQPVRTTEELILSKPQKSENGYADVGFSILEKKDKVGGKFGIEIPVATTTVSRIPPNKIVPSYGSDSDNDHDDAPITEKDYVDFEKLTCLLCKRAFQSQEILNKHLKMSNLHKENLQKFNLARGVEEASAQSYRDRAKERRQKYGEDDSPPPNRSKERFQRELEKQQQAAMSAQKNLAATPIGENNVGNRLLQKMGWSEGQGLGRSNQGRTNIIEAESRAANAGLGSKTTAFGPGDDYKSYIKKMMKSRYESVDIK